MQKGQLEPSLQNLADYIIEKVDTNTNKTVNHAVDRAVEELAGVTARQFRTVEKRIDVFEARVDAKFEKVDEHFEDIKDHLVIIDNRIGVRPEFAFRES